MDNHRPSGWQKGAVMMTTLMPDTFGLIVLLSGVILFWVVLGRLILNILTGTVVQRYEILDKHDAERIDWRRTTGRKQRPKAERRRAA
jgi:hypothetical protein